jgi:dTDP-4-dehydrorhamnose reductase
LEEQYQCLGSDIADFDITDCDCTIQAIRKINPQVVINVAAFTFVDLCEQEKEKAFAVNGEGAKHVARGCREVGAKCIYLSTDYVFDGKKSTPYVEDDLPKPISVYGQSKLQGEKYVQEILDDFLIIRSSWLFGKEGSNFVKTVVRLSREREVLEIVNDQRGSPTYTKDLSIAISTLIAEDLKGIFHVSNSGSCTWLEFAEKILDLIGSSLRCIPISSTQCGRPAERPPFSVLSCEKQKNVTGIMMPHWEDALSRFIETIDI